VERNKGVRTRARTREKECKRGGGREKEGANEREVEKIIRKFRPTPNYFFIDKFTMQNDRKSKRPSECVRERESEKARERVKEYLRASQRERERKASEKIHKGLFRISKHISQTYI